MTSAGASGTQTNAVLSGHGGRRYNPLVAAFWAKLKAQNKPGKVIVVACMHKLLAIAYGVLRSGKPFDPNHLKPKGA